LKQLSKHLSFANVISCIALFVALSGAAYAAKTTLGTKAVKTQNLANGSVTTLKLRGGAVTNLKLRNGAVTGAKIAPATIGSSQLANGAVRSAQLGGGVVTEGKLKSGAVSSEKIATNAVTSSKLGPEAVGAGKLGKEAVTSDKMSATLLSSLIKNVSSVTATTSPASSTSLQGVTAECPPGKHVMGGGARIVFGSAESAAITESAPATKPHPLELLTGWSASARSSDPGTWAVEAFAICAEF
jgi:hypothetical protein